MIKYQKFKVLRPFAYTCDKCGKTYEIDGTFEEQMEAQEFLHIHFTGGYGSIFGDMNKRRLRHLPTLFETAY